METSVLYEYYGEVVGPSRSNKVSAGHAVVARLDTMVQSGVTWCCFVLLWLSLIFHVSTTFWYIGSSFPLACADHGVFAVALFGCCSLTANALVDDDQ